MIERKRVYINSVNRLICKEWNGKRDYREIRLVKTEEEVVKRT